MMADAPGGDGTIDPQPLTIIAATGRQLPSGVAVRLVPSPSGRGLG